jgi:hypothetical protein
MLQLVFGLYTRLQRLALLRARSGEEMVWEEIQALSMVGRRER